MPSPELLRPAPPSSIAFKTARLSLGRWPVDKIKIVKLPIDLEIRDVILNPCPLTSASFQDDVNRYSGVSNLDSSGPICIEAYSASRQFQSRAGAARRAEFDRLLRLYA